MNLLDAIKANFQRKPCRNHLSSTGSSWYHADDDQCMTKWCAFAANDIYIPLERRWLKGVKEKRLLKEFRSNSCKNAFIQLPTFTTGGACCMVWKLAAGVEEDLMPWSTSAMIFFFFFFPLLVPQRHNNRMQQNQFLRFYVEMLLGFQALQ